MTAFIRLVSLKIDMSVVCTLPRQFLVSKKYNANILQYRSQNMHNLYQTTINVLPYLQRSLHADASTSELIYIYIYKSSTQDQVVVILICTLSVY